MIFTLLSYLVFPLIIWAQLPPPPTESSHPGSRAYSTEFSVTELQCNKRKVTLFVPNTPSKGGPAVVYGHGQALDLKHYKATFEHLAKKGITVIFPMYDKGFFDQDWNRMASDFVKLTLCALKSNLQIDRDNLIYSGHSKGAYVASMAAGVEFESLRPAHVILFATAGFDELSVKNISPKTSLTIVTADQDSIVDRKHSENIFLKAPSTFKQLITVKSYNSSEDGTKADHFWPLTQGSLFGGGSVGPLHYYGSWKWLTAAAEDLAEGDRRNHPYIFGSLTADKGLAELRDEVQRSW